MKSKRLACSGSHDCKEGVEEGVPDQKKKEVMLGDLLWVKLHGSSWWPGQVVDANSVSESIKPSNRSVGEVLVRLYGSYKYLYVDPMKCRSEFESVLEQNNGSYIEIFQKALEKDIPSSKSHRGSKSKARVEASNDEKLKQNQIDKEKPTGGGLGKHPAVSFCKTRAQKAKLLVENGGMKQHGVKKNISVNNRISARISPRRQQAANASQPKLKNSNLLAETTRKTSNQDKLHEKHKQSNQSTARESKCRNSKQNGVWKKLKTVSPSFEEEAKIQTSGHDKLQKKQRLNSQGDKEEAKVKMSMKAVVQKKLMPNGPSVAEETEGKSSNKQVGAKRKLKLHDESVEKEAKIESFNEDGPQNKLKRNSHSVEEDGKSKAHKQVRVQKKLKAGGLSIKKEDEISKTSEEDGEQKKLKPNSPNSSTLLTESQELSERRMKVMQNLGLMAPTGSPFNRDRHI